MDILILGASGFIGNACYDYFSQNNKVIGVDFKDQYLKGLIIDPDSSVTKKLIADHRFEVIINCAGSANIKESFVSPQSDFLSNTAYLQTILVLIKENSPETKLINISSAAVYGNPEKLPVSEIDKTTPLSPYGVHKLMSEKIMTEYCNLFNIGTLSVRIFSAYGIGLRHQFFFDLYSKLHLNPKQIALFGNGNESRDFIFISDILDAFNLLIGKGKFKGEVYNLASGKESMIKSSALLFAKILDYKGEITFTGKQLEGYPLNWCADISKLSALGFSPKVDLEKGLGLYARWLKNNVA